MLYDTLFPDLPDHARLWVYGTDRSLTEGEAQFLHDHLHPFVSGWQSHGRDVRGAFQVVYDRFILIAADIPGGDISGCGIDASVHALGAAAEHLGVTLLPALTIFYRDDTGAVNQAPRPVFRKLVRTGEVSAATIVFDPSITSVGALRTGAFECTMAASWHGQVFRVPFPSV
jgi:hypothetical protein